MKNINTLKFLHFRKLLIPTFLIGLLLLLKPVALAVAGPTLSGSINPASGSYSSSTLFSITASSNLACLEACQLAIFNGITLQTYGNNTTATWPNINYTAGTYHPEVRVVAISDGHTLASQSLGTLTITAPSDTIPPVVANIVASPAGWTSSGSVTISGTITDNIALAKYYKKCTTTEPDPGVEVPISGTPASFSFSFICSVQNTQAASVQAKDAAGNPSAWLSVPYYIDQTLPSATDNYSNSGWENSAQTITLSFNDAQSGINNGTRLYCIDTTDTCTPNLNYTAPVSVSAQGTNYIRYKVTDNAGNVSAISSKRVRIDTSEPINPPIFTATIGGLPANNLVVTVNNPTIVFNWSGAADVQSGVNDYEILLQKESPAQTVYDVTTGNTTTYTLTTANLEDGKTYLYLIRAKNSAGIPSTSFFLGGKFTVNLTVSIPAFQRCATWGGVWAGDAAPADPQQTGTCSFAQSAQRIALHKDVVNALPVICQSFKIAAGIIVSCSDNSPRWAKDNFTLVSGDFYSRKAKANSGVKVS